VGVERGRRTKIPVEPIELDCPNCGIKRYLVVGFHSSEEREKQLKSVQAIRKAEGQYLFPCLHCRIEMELH
jgi:hypothetical protein